MLEPNIKQVRNNIKKLRKFAHKKKKITYFLYKTLTKCLQKKKKKKKLRKFAHKKKYSIFPIQNLNKIPLGKCTSKQFDVQISNNSEIFFQNSKELVRSKKVFENDENIKQVRNVFQCINVSIAVCHHHISTPCSYKSSALKLTSVEMQQ